jgi:hypothetical protein
MTQTVINTGVVAGDGTGSRGQVPWNAFNTNSTELYSKAYFFGVDSGATNAYVATLASLIPNPAVAPALAAGVAVRITPTHVNTGASTFNFAGTGAVAIQTIAGSALVGGEMQPVPLILQYNGTAWQIVSSSASATQAGIGSILYPQTAAELAAGVTPVNFFWPVGYVDRYGTNTTPGTTNMTTAITNAIAVIKQQGGGEIVFQPGVDYFVVPAAGGPTGVTAFTMSAMSNVTIRGRARIVSNTPTPSIPVIFLLQDCNQVTFDSLRFYDTGANISVDFQGPWCVYPTTTTSNDCGGIHLKDVETQNVLGPFAAVLTTGTGRVRGIHFSNLKADTCYYGTPSLQNQGDAVTGNVIVNNCRRAGFPYGITGMNMTYDIWHDASSVGANATLDIKRYTRDTSGIKIRVSFHGFLTQFGSLVNFESQSTLANLGITGFGAITAGSGYVSGWYANVPLTGGTGTGATATIEIVSGAVAGVWICNRGNGYLTSDSLSCAAASVGGTGSGFAVAVSAVGGTISNVDIDLDLSGATYADPTVTGTTPFPVQFRSLAPGGSLNTTTTDVYDNITIRGNLGDWSFAQPGQTPQAINILSVQTGLPGRLHLGGDFFGNFGGSPQWYPGFVVRTTADTDVFTKLGDLTAAPVAVDLSKYDGQSFALRITIHAVLNWASGGSATNNEYIITGYKIAGSAPNLATTTAGLSSTVGTVSTVSFASSGGNLNVSFTNYNNAQSYLKMSVQHLDRFL